MISGALMASCFVYGGEDDEAAPPPPPPPDSGTDSPNVVDSSTPPVDASNDTGAEVDAGPCDPKKPFAGTQPIAEVNTPDEESAAHLSTDELTLYLSRNTSVAVYTRASRSEPFKGGAGLDVNGDNATSSRITDDTLRAYFSAYLGGGVGATRLITKSRPTTTDSFIGQSNRAFDFGTAPGMNEVDPYPTLDESAVYFASDRDNGATYELWVTRKNTTGGWGAPTMLGGVVAPNPPASGGDRRPVVSADKKTIYFTTTRAPGSPGKGVIWFGTAAAEADSFVVAAATGTEAANPSNSYPMWISPDQCRLYFISDRAGGKGMHDLWIASRSAP